MFVYDVQCWLTGFLIKKGPFAASIHFSSNGREGKKYQSVQTGEWYVHLHW